MEDALHIRTQVVITATGEHCRATYSTISHSYGLFAADYSTLHPLGKMVLHDTNIVVTVLSPFKGTHQIPSEVPYIDCCS